MVLCSPTINLLNQGYRLYLHNYYLKEELLLYSHDNKTYETGTAHADRSGFPKCIIHKSKWGFPWGSDEWRINGPVLAQVWMDNKPAYFMTTLHRPIHQIDTPQNKEVVRRKGKRVKRMGLAFLALFVFQIITIIWVTLITPFRLWSIITVDGNQRNGTSMYFIIF